jgi:hypothetical protein
MIGEKNELKMRISQRMLCGKIANRQTHMMLNRNKILLMFTNFSFRRTINQQHDRNEFLDYPVAFVLCPLSSPTLEKT